MTSSESDSRVLEERHLQLECVLGRGSYAKVFAARHKLSGHIYALKVIKKALLVQDEVCFTRKDSLTIIVLCEVGQSAVDEDGKVCECE